MVNQFGCLLRVFCEEVGHPVPLSLCWWSPEELVKKLWKQMPKKTISHEPTMWKSFKVKNIIY